MITIEAIGKISPEGELVVKLPTKLPPGEHRVVVVVDTKPEPDEHAPLNFPAYPAAPAAGANELPTVHVGRWPKTLSFRREDIYGDEGR